MNKNSNWKPVPGHPNWIQRAVPDASQLAGAMERAPAKTKAAVEALRAQIAEADSRDGVPVLPDTTQPLDCFLFHWVCGDDSQNTEDFQQAKKELLEAIAAHVVPVLDEAKERVAFEAQFAGCGADGANKDSAECESGWAAWLARAARGVPVLGGQVNRTSHPDEGAAS